MGKPVMVDICILGRTLRFVVDTTTETGRGTDLKMSDGDGKSGRLLDHCELSVDADRE
jgi:hypothetical protein